MVRVKFHRFLLMVLGIVASTWCGDASAIALSDCLTQSDVTSIDRDFFGAYPDRVAFEKFVDPVKFELLTNVADGAMLQRTAKPASEKIDWFLGMVNDHPTLFPDRTSFEPPVFDYVKGQLRGVEPSVENGRATKTFPKHECVLDVAYHAKGTQCVMNQRLSNLAITFIKQKHKIKLTSVEVFFIACPESKGGN
jgi:hypothetical protein